MGKSGKKWGKIGKVVKSGEKWEKVGKSGEKLRKTAKSDEKLEKVGIFFTKWPGAAILDDRKSLSITFLAISINTQLLFFFIFFLQNGRWRPFWIPIFYQNR